MGLGKHGVQQQLSPPAPQRKSLTPSEQLSSLPASACGWQVGQKSSFQDSAYAYEGKEKANSSDLKSPRCILYSAQLFSLAFIFKTTGLSGSSFHAVSGVSPLSSGPVPRGVCRMCDLVTRRLGARAGCQALSGFLVVVWWVSG